MNEIENVEHFLLALQKHLHPATVQLVESIRRQKSAREANALGQPVQPWDRDYYLPSTITRVPPLLPSVTVGTTLRALSRLFTHLYGISLRPSNIASGEVWSEDVQKLEVVDESYGTIGWIYTDLLERDGKHHGAAHFTVQCSRKLNSEETDAAQRSPERIGSAVQTKDGLWQLPIVVLVCSFSRDQNSQGAEILEWNDVKTLFHEMGHAMHCKSSAIRVHAVFELYSQP